MLSRKIEKLQQQNLDELFCKIVKKFKDTKDTKITKAKLKNIWLRRDDEIYNYSPPPKTTVLEKLAQLKVTEKILRIGDRYVHRPSGFVFDPISKKVIGRIDISQDDEDCRDLPTRELTKSDLEDCKQWKFDCFIPMNLDKNFDELENEIDKMHFGDDDSEIQD